MFGGKFFWKFNWCETFKLPGDNPCADDDHRTRVSLGPIALLCNYKLVVMDEKKKFLKKTHVVCFMYKLIESSRVFDSLSTCFNRNIEAREQEKSYVKRIEKKYHSITSPKKSFLFGGRQENAEYCLTCLLTMQRKSDIDVLRHSPSTWW